MHYAGLQTPDEQQQQRLQNINSISTAQSLDQYRAAQAQALQMVNVQSPVEKSSRCRPIPRRRFGRRRAVRRSRRLTPRRCTGIDWPTCCEVELIHPPTRNCSRSRKHSRTSPPNHPDTATAAKSAYMGIIGKMQAAGALNSDYLTSPQHLSAAIQAAGKKGVLTPAEVQQGTGFMATYTTPAATAANVNVKIDAGQAQQGIDSDTPLTQEHNRRFGLHRRMRTRRALQLGENSARTIRQDTVTQQSAHRRNQQN